MHIETLKDMAARVEAGKRLRAEIDALMSLDKRIAGSGISLHVSSERGTTPIGCLLTRMDASNKALHLAAKEAVFLAITKRVEELEEAFYRL